MILRVGLVGKYADRERKIAYYQECGVCSKCYRDKKSAQLAMGCTEVEMHYSDYLHNYADCETKKGSYNGDTKTIIVYVPDGYNN